MDCSEQLINRTCFVHKQHKASDHKDKIICKGHSDEQQLHIDFVTNFIAAEAGEQQQQHSPTTS